MNKREMKGLYKGRLYFEYNWFKLGLIFHNFLDNYWRLATYDAQYRVVSY